MTSYHKYSRVSLFVKALLKSTMDMFLFQWCVRSMTAHIPDTHPCDGLSQGSVSQYFSTRLITDPWENTEKGVLIFPKKKKRQKVFMLQKYKPLTDST